jgi:serine/threonine-protein kinase
VVAPLPALSTGDVVSGRYKVEAHLGSGATSAVWRARDLDLGRVVALKVLHGAGVDPQLAGRFEREGQILGRLSHPSVVPVYATGNDGGRPYLVMAYVDGMSLDRVLAEGPLSVDDALDLAADVAAGLAAAHRAGVVHRDVKPANIVCGTDGVPRLVDFGIARADDLTAMTQADSVLGTASYLSPEQARGEVPGPASDVYALGCVLHEALTGRPPFEGDSPLSVAYKHVHDDPAPLRSLRPEVPGAVEAVVLRALAKAPADRYPSGAELEADLRRARRGEAPVRATEATQAVPAVTDVPADATMLMPAVAAGVMGTTGIPAAADASGGPEVIDPSPLVEPEPPTPHPWGIAAGAVAAAVVVIALLLSTMGGGGDGGTPAGATDRPATTTSTTAAVQVTATVPTTLPVQVQVKAPKAPKPGKGKGHGKG